MHTHTQPSNIQLPLLSTYRWGSLKIAQRTLLYSYGKLCTVRGQQAGAVFLKEESPFVQTFLSVLTFIDQHWRPAHARERHREMPPLVLVWWRGESAHRGQGWTTEPCWLMANTLKLLSDTLGRLDRGSACENANVQWATPHLNVPVIELDFQSFSMLRALHVKVKIQRMSWPNFPDFFSRVHVWKQLNKAHQVCELANWPLRCLMCTSSQLSILVSSFHIRSWYKPKYKHFLLSGVFSLFFSFLSSIQPSTRPLTLNVPTKNVVEFLCIWLIPPLSIFFLTISTVIPASLSSDIFKPSPWGEQKPASIWNRLFCSVHESRTKPWQKNSCTEPLCYLFLPALFVFAGEIVPLSKYLLCCCAAVVDAERAWSLAAHQSCHK